MIRAEVRVREVKALMPGQARTFCFERGAETIRGFLLRLDSPDTFVAYRNHCPHVGFDLDMGSGEFWSAKTRRIYCRSHGARFRPLDGVCDVGPCLGQALESFGVRIEGDDAWVIVG